MNRKLLLVMTIAAALVFSTAAVGNAQVKRKAETAPATQSRPEERVDIPVVENRWVAARPAGLAAPGKAPVLEVRVRRVHKRDQLASTIPTYRLAPAIATYDSRPNRALRLAPNRDLHSRPQSRPQLDPNRDPRLAPNHDLRLVPNRRPATRPQSRPGGGVNGSRPNSRPQTKPSTRPQTRPGGAAKPKPPSINRPSKSAESPIFPWFGR